MSPSADTNVQTDYGASLVNGLSKEDDTSSSLRKDDIHDLVLRNFRLLVVDLCQEIQ